MLIKGFQKSTLLDYPGKIACTVFLFGCNFRCPYCHNPELVDSTLVTNTKIYTEEEIFQFLREHNKFLEGVCITGGEPMLNKDLPEFIRKIKRIGHYGVKLDTNGTNPEMLELLWKEKLADYVAMDFKAPLEKYKEAVNAEVNIEALKKSVSIIKMFPNYEFRITAVPKLTTKQDILKIAWFLKENNANDLFTIQQFEPKKCLDKSFEKEKHYSEEELKDFQKMLKDYFKKVELRGLD